MISPRSWLAYLCVAGLLGCVEPAMVASDCVLDSGVCPSAAWQGGGFGTNNGGPIGGEDAGSGAIRSGRIARVDLLLVVDRSASTSAERDAFVNQLAPLLRALLSGDADGGGQPEFLPVSDLHVGLVSSDLGAGAASGNCTRAGDEAELLMGREAPPSGCADAAEGFLSLEADGDLESTADQLGCWIRGLAEGCRMEQPLTAALEAWRRENQASLEPSDAGAPRHFARPDSLQITLVLADEDDCSAEDPERLLVAGDRSSTRCASDVDRLSRVPTLAAELRSVRELAQDLSLLAVLTGVPAHLVDVAARLEYDGGLESSTGRQAFYDALLQDPSMMPVSTSAGSEVEGDRVGVMPSCTSGALLGYPAPRLVEAVSLFGAQGVVQSVCDPEAWRLVAHTIGRRLGPPER